MERNVRAMWPFPWSAWPAAPWEMRGRVVTAWFRRNVQELGALANAELLDSSKSDVLCRIRFYDIEYTSLAAENDRSAPRSGSFREAVVAYRGLYGGVGGDVSAVMMTDSFPYLAWGRDVFGWPLEPAAFQFEGPLWSSDPSSGVSSSVAKVGDTRISLRGSLGAESPLKDRPKVTWLTPRSVPDPCTLDEDLQMLLVYPRWVTTGTRYALDDVHLEIQAGPDLRLAALQGDIEVTSADVLSGFVMVVGESVDCVRGQALLATLAESDGVVRAQTQW